MSRHSPLATNSFIIRTSETPLPQLLYNPHLQAPLGSAGNKGLITPLKSALTSTAGNKGLITPLESALTKRWGWGSFLPVRNSPHAARHCPLCSSPFFSDYSTLFWAFLPLPKNQLFCFHGIPHSLPETPGCGVGGIVLTSDHSPQCLGVSVAAPSFVPAPDFAPWLFPPVHPFPTDSSPPMCPWSPGCTPTPVSESVWQLQVVAMTCMRPTISPR